MLRIAFISLFVIGLVSLFGFRGLLPLFSMNHAEQMEMAGGEDADCGDANTSACAVHCLALMINDFVQESFSFPSLAFFAVLVSAFVFFQKNTVFNNFRFHAVVYRRDPAWIFSVMLRE